MFDCNTFKDKRHLLILVAIILPSKELQFCNFTVVDHRKVGGLILKKLPTCNTFRDKIHLPILVAITQLSKELQFCNFTMW